MPFAVAKPNLLLELHIVVLDTPAQFGVIDQSMKDGAVNFSSRFSSVC
jgi:hypothetical protein